MTYEQIRSYARINEVDEEKVNALVESIKKNGWVGCPILVIEGQIITGSHRMAALDAIYNSDDYELILDLDVAEDVTDLVNAAFERYDENGYYPDLEFDRIGWMFEGTWVEQYKDEIVEW